MPKDYIEISGAGKVVKVRDALVPVINILKTLGHVSRDVQAKNKEQDWQQRKNESLSSRREETMLVIIESVNEQMAMPVDDILGQAQVVVKPLATGQNIPEVAGAAILGDGRTVLILDPAMIVAHVAHPAKDAYHKAQTA
jgi:two-component system chemotaxis sensor kinase CheA